MSELPKGWVEAPLMDVVELKDARRVPLNKSQREARRGNIPYYGANGLVDHVDDYLFEGRHMLLAEDGGNFDAPHKGVAYLVDGKFWVNNHAHVVAALGGMNVDYLAHWANSFDWMPYVGGTTRLKLSQAGMKRVSIPLAPLEEQKRIAAKIDSLNAKSARARTEFAKIEALVERYKAAVFCQALSGRMFLSSAELTNAHSFNDDKDRGRWPFTAIPPDWDWVSFVQFLENKTDSKRKLAQKNYLSEGAFPVIDQGEKLIGGYSSDESLVLQADPPFIIFGDHTRCVKFFEAPFIQGADGIKVFAAKPGIEPRFAYWAMKALEIPNKGYSRHTKFLKESFFPRPSVGDQKKIVTFIEFAMQRMEAVLSQCTSAGELAKKLDEKVLTTAFAGELVQQDPADEPATELLARIRAVRDNAPKKPRQRRQGGKTKVSPIQKLHETLASWPEAGLTFEELRKDLPGTYEAQKDAIFDLISSDPPKLRQEFDENDQIMKLRKV